MPATRLRSSARPQAHINRARLLWPDRVRVSLPRPLYGRDRSVTAIASGRPDHRVAQQPRTSRDIEAPGYPPGIREHFAESAGVAQVPRRGVPQSVERSEDRERSPRRISIHVGSRLSAERIPLAPFFGSISASCCQVEDRDVFVRRCLRRALSNCFSAGVIATCQVVGCDGMGYVDDCTDELLVQPRTIGEPRAATALESAEGFSADEVECRA